VTGGKVTLKRGRKYSLNSHRGEAAHRNHKFSLVPTITRYTHQVQNYFWTINSLLVANAKATAAAAAVAAATTLPKKATTINDEREIRHDEDSAQRSSAAH